MMKQSGGKSAEIFSFQEEKNKRERQKIITDAQTKINQDLRLTALSSNISDIVAEFLNKDTQKACVALTIFGFVDEARRLVDLNETNGEDMYHTRNYISQNYG